MPSDENYIEKTLGESMDGTATEGVDDEWDDELDELVQKGRRYISDPSEAPGDVEVQEGERGGYYYETEGGEEPSAEGGDAGGVASGAPDEVAADPDVALDWMTEEFGELGQEYVEEAAHQYGGHWEEFYDSPEDLIDDFETYIDLSYDVSLDEARTDGGDEESDTGAPELSEGPRGYETYDPEDFEAEVQEAKDKVEARFEEMGIEDPHPEEAWQELWMTLKEDVLRDTYGDEFVDNAPDGAFDELEEELNQEFF